MAAVRSARKYGVPLSAKRDEHGPLWVIRVILTVCRSLPV